MVKDRGFYRAILAIALPSAFQTLVSFLVVVADDIMVSSMAQGVAAQAAVSQVNSMTAFFTATMQGLVGGSSVLIAQYWGKQDRDAIQKIFAMVMGICVAVAVVFTLAGVLGAGTVCGWMVDRQETEVYDLACRYFSVACFTFIPYAMTAALQGMLRAVEVVRVMLYVSLASLLVNVSLNYVLIFGKLGFPALGVEGAALATVITRVVELGIVGWYTFRVQKALPIRVRDMIGFTGWLFKDYMHYGMPVAVTDLQWSLIGMLKAAIIGQMGAAFMAANSITNAMLNLGMLFTSALAGGASVVVGKAVGEGDMHRVKAYARTIEWLFAAMGVVMAAVVWLLAKPFVSLYGSSSDPEVFSLAVTMIGILALTMLGSGYHVGCFVGINRGAGDSRFVALVDMICGWLVVLPLTYLAAFVWHWPLPAIFLATRIDQCYKWIIAFIRLRGDRWIKRVTRPAAERGQA